MSAAQIQQQQQASYSGSISSALEKACSASSCLFICSVSNLPKLQCTCTSHSASCSLLASCVSEYNGQCSGLVPACHLGRSLELACSVAQPLLVYSNNPANPTKSAHSAVQDLHTIWVVIGGTVPRWCWCWCGVVWCGVVLCGVVLLTLRSSARLKWLSASSGSMHSAAL